MSALVIGGDVSGTVTLQAPSAAGSTVLTLPSTSGTLVTTAGGNATSATNLADGVAGQLPYQSSPGVTAFVANGTSGQSLLSNGSGSPTWGTPSVATNLAGGSAGTVPYQSASGTTAMLSAGTSGQVLTSSGAGAPTWTTPSAGAMTLISTLTASNSPSLEWTGLTAGYYMLRLEYLYTYSGGNKNTYIQFGSGAGPTYATSGYTIGGQYNGSSGGYYNLSSSGTGIDVTLGTNVVGTLSGTFFISNGSGLDNPNFTGTYGQSTYTCTVFGKSPSLGGTLTAIRIILSSGNIQSGKASLYSIST